MNKIVQSVRITLVKVVVWRIVSVLLTLVITYLYIGSITKSLGLALILQAALVVSHLGFELIWPKLIKRYKKKEKKITGD